MKNRRLERLIKFFNADEQALLLSFEALCLTADEVNGEWALCICGPRGSGKSTLLKALLERLEPCEKLVLNAKDLTRRFGLAALTAGVRAIVVDGRLSARGTAVLNELICGEPVIRERRQSDPVELKPRAQVIIIADGPLQVPESAGLLRRLQVIEMRAGKLNVKG